MPCSGSFITSYFFWAILSGLFAGFGLSRLLRFPQRSDVEARHWKWIMFSLYLSVAVVLALCAAFIPSSLCSTQRLRVSPAFLDYRILTAAAVAAIAGLLGLRFKRIVGLPLLFFIVVGVSAIPVLRHPWQRYEAGAPVAEFRLLSIANGKRSMEFTPMTGGTYFVELPGTGIAIEASVLRTSEYYFFIDRPMMYKLESIGPAENDGSEHNIASRAENAGNRFQEWLQRGMENLPGWEVGTIRIETERLLPLFRYAAFLGGDDGPAIRLVQPEW